MASLSRANGDHYQMTLLESFSHLALKKEIQKQQESKNGSYNPKETLHPNSTENYFNCLDKISCLDLFLSELANHAAANTAEMVDQARDKRIDFSEHLSQNFVQCWEWVMQTIHLAELHVTHAADYQKFHFNADDLLVTMSKSSYQYYRYHPATNPVPASMEVQHLTSQLQEHMNHLSQCKEQTEFLCNQAKDLVPVYLRNATLETPQPAVWLCRYKSNAEQITLEPQEQITVLDNSTAAVWRIKTLKGQVVDVPAIGCMITGPELAANGKDRNLREVLYKAYRSAYKAFSPEVSRIIKGILADVLSNKQIIEDNHQKDFLSTLAEYNEILNSALGDLSRDPIWVKEYDRCKDYLSRRQPQPTSNHIGRQQLIGADLINQLRVMIRLLKDLRRLVSVLRRKLRPSDVSSEKSLTKEEMLNSSLSLNSMKGSQTSLAPNQRQSKLYTQIKPYNDEPYSLHVNVGPSVKKSVHLEVDVAPKFRTRKLVTLKTSLKQNMAVKKIEVSKVSINLQKRMIEDHSSYKKSFFDRAEQSSGNFVEKKPSKIQSTQTQDMKQPSKMQSTQTQDMKKTLDIPTQTSNQVLVNDYSSYSKVKPTLTRGDQTTVIAQTDKTIQFEPNTGVRGVQTDFQRSIQVSGVQTDDFTLLNSGCFYETPKIVNTVAVTQTDFKRNLLMTESCSETRPVVDDFSCYSVDKNFPKLKNTSSQTLKLILEQAESCFQFDPDTESVGPSVKKTHWLINDSSYETESPTVVQDSSSYRIEKLNKRLSVFWLTNDFSAQYEEERKPPEFGDVSEEVEEKIKEKIKEIVSSERRSNPDKICQTQKPPVINIACQVNQVATFEKALDPIKSRVYDKVNQCDPTRAVVFDKKNQCDPVMSSVHDKGNQCDNRAQLLTNMKASQCITETELTAQIRFKDCELQGLEVLSIENKLSN